jgi:isopenicillin N synthase-like dioxygenase
MSHIGVPLIDISPSYNGTMKGKRLVAEQINAACIDLGFFAITGHGVPMPVINEFRKVSHAFFEQPITIKLKALHPMDGTPRGYRIFAGEALGRATTAGKPPDLKEFYHIGPDKWPNNEYYTGKEGQKYFIPNIWPDNPANFKSVALAYYQLMESLERHLLRLSAIALGISEEYFDDKVDKHISAMRINYYPPQPKLPLEGQFRAGAHTDYGGMTILMGEDEAGGLQVRIRSGDWVDVQTRPEYFIVNIGDLLMHWTNDVWVSNLHRVSNPPPEVARTAHRISIVFFHQPNYNALIECIPTCANSDNPPRYPPVRSGDYRDQKYTETLINGAAT